VYILLNIILFTFYYKKVEWTYYDKLVLIEMIPSQKIFPEQGDTSAIYHDKPSDKRLLHVFKRHSPVMPTDLE